MAYKLLAEPVSDRQQAETYDRCIAAGLTPAAATVVAERPFGGPIVLAPGVVLTVFAPPGREQVAVVTR